MNPAALVFMLAVLPPQPQPIQVPEPHETLVHSAIASAAIGQFTDLSTTMYAMGRGGFSEANPLLAWAEDRPVSMGVVKGVVAVGTTYGLIKLHRSRPKTAFAAAVGLTVLQGWVTWKNSQTIRGRQ